MGQERQFRLRLDPIHSGYGWLYLFAGDRCLTDYLYRGRQLSGFCSAADIRRWISAHLPDFLRDDPFPAQTAGSTAAEMWFSGGGWLPCTLPPEGTDPALTAWLDRHALCTCNAQYCLPQLFFRSTEAGVEISWQNRPFRLAEVQFLYESGSIVVDKPYFEAAVTCFLEECAALIWHTKNWLPFC